MNHERGSGRVLRLMRPVLLAGAAATIWLALSASAATADTGTDSGSGLDATGSSPASSSAPRLAGLGSSVDSVIGAVPEAADVVEPVKTQILPAVALVDTVVDSAGAGTTAVPRAVLKAVPVTAPLVAPIAELLASVTLPPVPTVPAPPELPAGAEAPAVLPSGGTHAVSADAPGAAAAVKVFVQGERDGNRRDSVVPATTPALLPLPSDSINPANSLPALPGDGLPDALPSAPGASAGSGPSSSGFSGTNALAASSFQLLLPSARGNVNDSHDLAPEALPFDPGSSPD